MKEKMKDSEILDFLYNLKFGFQMRFNEKGKISWITIEEIGEDRIPEMCDLFQPTYFRIEEVDEDCEDLELFLD